MELDHTIVVEYTIHTTTPLHNVVPELIPPSCAVSGGIPLISCTTDLSAPIATMSGGSSHTVQFFVHLYEEPSICGDTNPLCSGGNLFFTLNLHSSEGTFPASDTGSFLHYTSPENDILALDFVSSERITPIIAQTSHTGIPLENLYDLGSSGYDIQDPDTKIYLYIDWQANAPTAWSHHLFYGLTDNCSERFIQQYQNGEIELFDGIAEDRTSPNPDNWFEINQAPFGGGGSVADPTKGLGINLFDISSANSTCGDSVRNHLDYNLTSTYFFTFSIPVATMFREIKIMLGHLSNCVAEAPIFLAAPSSSEFKITSISLSSDGEVSASLETPVAWKSGPGQPLMSDYSVEWYLKSPTSLKYLGNSGQQLDITAQSGLTISEFSDYSVEARVVYDDGSHLGVVSTQSTAIGFNLNLNALSYFEAEDYSPAGSYDPDEFLDSGETVEVGITMNREGTPYWPFQAGDIAFGFENAGVTYFTNTYQLTGPNIKMVDKVLATPIGDNQNLFLSYQLLNSGGATTADLVVEASEIVDGVPITIRKSFNLKDFTGLSLDLDQEYSQNFETFDFTSNDFLFFNSSIDTFVSKAMGTGEGWIQNTLDGVWSGSTGLDPQPTDWNKLYILKSPAFSIGDNMQIQFDHQPSFTFNQSGGILEYALVDSSGQPLPGSGWSNIYAIATTNFYDPFTFPDNFSSYLSGQKCWMTDHSTAQPVSTFLNTSSFSNYIGSETVFIQFRFVFQDPSLDPQAVPSRSTGPTSWDINSFYYESYSYKPDNFFHAEIRDDSNPINSCQEPMELSLERQSPFALQDLNYGWFESLQDIYDGVTETSGSGVYGNGFPTTFAATTNTFWVLLSSDDLQTERIIPFSVLVPDGFMSSRDALLRIWSEQPDWTDGQRSVIDFVTLINLVCE